VLEANITSLDVATEKKDCPLPCAQRAKVGVSSVKSNTQGQAKARKHTRTPLRTYFGKTLCTRCLI